ncbi:unnamed protein product [Heligmosomoides polygyrus]|uniref:Uncharacterized protein n=1 Tax=Heligmosomoides polygyrus TaxID=6339 RepID=A0A183GG66_HELPZ|nr:unnamed protein product [Heligmosomoides polygyrus]
MEPPSHSMAPKSPEKTTGTTANAMDRLILTTFQRTEFASLDASYQRSSSLEELWSPLRRPPADKRAIKVSKTQQGGMWKKRWRANGDGKKQALREVRARPQRIRATLLVLMLLGKECTPYVDTHKSADVPTFADPQPPPLCIVQEMAGHCLNEYQFSSQSSEGEEKSQSSTPC